MLPLSSKTKTPDTIPQFLEVPDLTGKIASYQPGGPTTTSNNAFFSSTLGVNGRSCITCHQPQNGWGLAPSTVVTTYANTLGRDALFQPVDGSDCPNLGGAAYRYGGGFVDARVQLFSNANIRIDLPVPQNADWASLTIKHDPNGCQTSLQYGLPAGFISMYRRPLPAA